MKDKPAVITNLKHALTFVGQAQEAVGVSGTPLFKELGSLYDELDSILESVREGDYD